MKIIKVREINMRGTKDKKTGGMNLKKPKISLVLIFTIILSIFTGLFSPMGAHAAPTADGRVVYSNTTTTPQSRSYAVSSNTFATAAAMQTGVAQTFMVDRAAPARNEHIAGYVTATGVLYIQRWNGTAWSAEWNVTVGGNGIDGRRFDIAYEKTTGNAMVVYSTNATGAAGNEMAYRIWNGTSWTAAVNINSARFAQAATVTWIKMKSNPLSGSNEIAMTAADSGTTTANTSVLTSFIWNGSAWTEPTAAHTTATTVYLPNTTGQLVQNDCFDLAYESLTGDLIVVFTTATPQQWYITKTAAGTWGTAVSYATARAVPLQMVAESDPQSNQILVMFNRSASTSVYGNVWTGTAVGTTTTISNANGATTAIEKKSIAAKWLVVGGTSYAIPMWATSTAGTIGYAQFNGSTTTWTSGASGFTYVTGTGTAQQWMDVDRDPQSSDTMMLTFSDSANDLFAKRLVMTGSAAFTWTNADGGATLNAALASITSQNFSFAYNKISGDSVNVADGTDPANANAGRGSADNVADSFTMVSTNVQDGAASVTGVTASLTNSADVSGIRLYNDNGTVGTYEAGTDTLLSTGTPGASVSFTGFTENLTTSASNYLILVDIASGATLTNTIDTSVTAVTVTSPDLQGTISDASNPTRLTVVDLPHENASTALNSAIAASPILEGTTGVLMQRFQVSSVTSGAGAQDNQLELNSLGIDDLGTATGTRTAKAYIDTTSSATLPGTAVLIGTLSSWTGAPTTITLNQGTAGDRTVTNATPRYIYIVYDLPAGATQTVQSSITSVGAVSPDAGQTGLTLNSNAITLSADPSSITSCAGCHGYGATLTDGTARNVPDGKFPGSHNKHVNTYSKACSVCHTAPATETSADFNHRNGTIQMANPINGNSGAAYTKGASWTQVNPPTAFTGCTNTYCHSSGAGVASGTIPSNTSITWGTTATCGSCHGDANGRPNYANNGGTPPKKNSHFGTTHAAQTCDKCHYSTTTTGNTITSATLHTNGAYNVNAGTSVTFTYSYNAGGGSCATVSCHGDAQWGVTQFDCVTCHSSAMGPRRIIAGASGEFALAYGHKKTGQGAVTKYDCIVCHMEGDKSTGSPNGTYHANGTIELRDPDTGTQIMGVTFGGTGAGGYTSTGTPVSFTDFSRDLSVKFTSDTAYSTTAAIMINHCLKCHDANGAASAEAQVPTTGTALKPFGTTVASTATYYLNNIAAANTAGSVVDVNTSFASANASYHPVRAKQNNSYTSLNTAERMKAPWTGVSKTAGTPSYGSLMSCWDCHAPAGTLSTVTLSSTVTAHGAASTIRRDSWTAATAATPNLCTVCHIDSYGVTNGTANHAAGSAFATGGDGTRYNISICMNCHSSFNNSRPWRGVDVHGFNLWAELRPTDVTTPANSARSLNSASGHKPYSFIRTDNLSSINPNTTTVDDGATWVAVGNRPGCVRGTSLCGNSHGTITPGGAY
ncbi:MAG: CxxxxCH/CxxCH domain-containing protein [Nitrospirae bacterium]|nr:CxxxxCH/CxxCH domain-containing protein [Nitrospirota bacterium]